jgi:hypothetical protein
MINRRLHGNMQTPVGDGVIMTIEGNMPTELIFRWPSGVTIKVKDSAWQETPLQVEDAIPG